MDKFDKEIEMAKPTLKQNSAFVDRVMDEVSPKGSKRRWNFMWPLATAGTAVALLIVSLYSVDLMNQSTPPSTGTITNTAVPSTPAEIVGSISNETVAAEQELVQEVENEELSVSQLNDIVY